MGRYKLPIEQKRVLRQYYLTPAERAQVDAFVKKIRKITDEK